MRMSIPLGRFGGVRIGLHWSVVGIVALVAVGLGAYWLPDAFPGHAPMAYALCGIAAAVLLVLSVLVHELAHAVVARRNGVAVQDITLWLLGGVARLRGEAATAWAELRIAVVGPVSSAVLAVLFGAAEWAAGRLGAGELTIAVLDYLAVLNGVLAVFNLVPAAPLDGGRVLRAVLWAWRGDRYRAAVWSALAGRCFGFLLIAGGLVVVLTRGSTGLWWMVLGLFVVNVATAEERQARLGIALAGVAVRDVMSSPVQTLPAGQSVGQFFHDAVLHHRHTTYPLVDERGAVCGLVTLQDLRALPMQSRGETTLRAVAHPVEEVAVAEPDEPLARVLPRMTGVGRGRVIVCRHGELCGIVSPSDIARALSDHTLAAALPSGADLSWEPDSKQPPSNWWYHGQRRPR